MQAQFLLNGSVSLVLSPDNDAEEALIKLLLKQDNDIVQIRANINVLNKSYNNGIVIAAKGKHARNTDDNKEEELL